ncbi:hypothetical protein [Klebsiella quasivariicola]|uniref:hypothetical protein n=1 Tax=Klebsiella quasivariicola TaxID=2026240 RepID=UPI0035B0556B
MQLRDEKGEKSPLRKKDRKKACAKNWDPYNAHPLTRQDVNHFTQTAGSVEEKNPEIQG